MKAPQDIIIRPVMTEKSIMSVGEKKYTFKVAKDSNKIEIAQAVEVLFGVKVKKVNTMNCKGRWKRMGMNVGYQPDYKKAIVTLTEDSKGIEVFESLA